MSETNKSYRIRTSVGEETGNISIPVSLVQDFDSVDILSLSIKSIDEYRKHSANYGVVVGRVLANNGFGIPNAKISVFIDADSEDDAVMKYLYPYSSSFDEDSNKVRYNLLPDEYVSDCHQIVGTFPNKRFMLDNDVLLEVFDKYYKFTTRTNKSGDYLICGVPTGRQTIHMDLDISDCGILSQRPRDFVYKGYNIEQFENPNKFKDGTNYNELSQIFTQDKTINVEPFWGNATDGESIGITRADINVAFKFEPTCVFMGSVVSDNASNGITQKCIATPHMGDMDELTTGEGTIEMIRKTPNGGVEEFQIKGTQLINANGVWCYQIPMNLDYMMTDEYGNMVPTDDPDKGIPTRARVRFRLSLTDNENAKESYYRPKVLVPNNPDVDGQSVYNRKLEYDYIFGTDTKEDSYRDLFWNNVYSVKSFIPRFQKSRLLKHAWKDEKFTGIKHCNIFGPNNPIPYNNIRFRIPFMFLILCALINAFIKVVGYVNVVITHIYTILMKISASINGLVNWASSSSEEPWWKTIGKAILTGGVSLLVSGAGNFIKKRTEKIENFANGTFRYITIDNGLCPDLEKWYFAPRGYNKNLLDFTVSDLAAEIKVKNDSGMQDAANKLLEDKTSIAYQNSSVQTICLTNRIDYLITCVEMNLAQEYKVINFDFYNDWINGLIYIPRFKKYIRPKSTSLGFIKIKQKTKGCIDDSSIFDNSRMYTQMCSIAHNINRSGDILPSSSHSKKYYEGSKGDVNVFNNGGVVHETQTMLGQSVFYLKPSELYWGTKINLYATDLILLGSLNDCDIYGIPQAFKNLTSSTYLLPPNLPLTNLEETGPLYAEADDNTTCRPITGIDNVKAAYLEINQIDVVEDGNGNITDVDERDVSGWQEHISEISETTPGAFKYRIINKNESGRQTMIAAFSAETETNGTISVEDNEHLDTIPLTEISGIAWNWSGPAQGNNTPDKNYYPGGHFLGMACWNIETSIKTCLNLSRICEIGSSMSERREDGKEIDEYGNIKYIYNVPTGLIGNESIIDSDIRTMFSTMNMKKLIANKVDKNGYVKYDFLYLRPNGFTGVMSGDTTGNSPYNSTDVDVISSYEAFKLTDYARNISKGESFDEDESASTQTKTLESKVDDYYRFRLGDNPGSHFVTPRLPMYENSFYFYFGLKDGATALDEFNKQFFSNCESKLIKDNEPIMTVELDETDGYNYESGTSKVLVTTKNIELPYDAFIGSFLPKSGNKTQWYEETTSDRIVVETNQANNAEGFGNYRFKASFNDGIAIENGINIGDDFFSADIKAKNFDIEMTHPYKLDGTYAKDETIGGFINIKNLNIKYYNNSIANKWKYRLVSKNYARDGVKFCPNCYGTGVTARNTGLFNAFASYYCTNCNSLLYTKGRVTNIIYDDVRLHSVPATATTTNTSTSNPHNDGTGIVYDVQYGQEQDLSVPYNGEWFVELLYDGEKLKEWGPFNVDHWYSTLTIENINKDVVKIPETFKNFTVSSNGTQVDWWKSCSKVNDELFRLASIDTRRPKEKTISNPQKSTIDAESNMRYSYGFKQVRNQSTGLVEITQDFGLLNTETYNDKNNVVGGTAPNGQEHNFFYITSQNPDTKAFWHTKVPNLEIENGIIRIKNNSTLWKNYIKVGYPCVYIDEDTLESVQANFTGDNTAAPSGIKNGVIKPMLYYPVINRPYSINCNIIEWFGLDDSSLNTPEWIKYLDTTGFFKSFVSLGYCLSGSVVSPFSSCTMVVTNKNVDGDTVDTKTFTFNKTVPQIWDANGTLVNVVSGGTNSSTLRASRYKGTYSIDVLFKNSANVTEERSMPIDNKRCAYNVYYSDKTDDTTAGITKYHAYFYFGNNTPDYDVDYYWFPLIDPNSSNDAIDRGFFTKNKFDDYYVITSDYSIPHVNVSLYSCYVYRGQLGVTVDIQKAPDNMTSVNDIPDKDNLYFNVGHIDTLWYDVPFLLSKDDKLVQVVITYGEDVWTLDRETYFLDREWSQNGPNNYPYNNSGPVQGFDDHTVIGQIEYMGGLWDVTIRIDNNAWISNRNGTTSYKFYGYGVTVEFSSVAHVSNSLSRITTSELSAYHAESHDSLNQNYTIYDENMGVMNFGMQAAKQWGSSRDALLEMLKNFNCLQIGTQIYYPAKRYIVNDSALNTAEKVNGLFEYLNSFVKPENKIDIGPDDPTPYFDNGYYRMKYGLKLPLGAEANDYGVFSVKKDSNEYGEKNKIMKIYPCLTNKVIMDTIETYRRQNNIDL